MKHHTKNKGDLGLMMVMADLAAHDIGICLPLSEHMPFDLVAVSEAGNLSRVQVKYRKAKKNCVMLPLRSSYSDGNGVHTRMIDRSQFDAFAIYCPDTKSVYYVRNDEIPESYVSGVLLRLTPAINNQVLRTRMGSQFLGPDRLFEKTPSKMIENEV
jgi:hypothetical protein